MKNFIKKYIIEKWWIPSLGFFASFILAVIVSDIAIFMSVIIGVLGLIVLIISGILQLFNKKWWGGVLNLVLSIGTIGTIIIFTISFIAMFGPDTDTFADDLELPKNVKLEKPIDTKMGDNFEAIRPLSKSNTPKNKIDFELYNSFQPGLYQYDLWIGSKESGVVYLKAYEITKRIELSSPSLKENSTIQINNTNDSIVRYSLKDDFTIYEGDWGKPYGARFEIWFKPDKGGKEKKLFEKNYIIEGWMR